MDSRLEVGFELDRRWHLIRGEMDSSKKPDLVALAALLASAGTPYSIIGGVALQIHQAEPRTTLDTVETGIEYLRSRYNREAKERLKGTSAQGRTLLDPQAPAPAGLARRDGRAPDSQARRLRGVDRESRGPGPRPQRAWSGRRARDID